MSDSTAGRTVKSVETACDIIDVLQERDGASVSELADAVDLSPGSIHTHLSTLKRRGYVVQQGTTYRLGPQFLPIGEYVRNHTSLFRAAKAEVDELAQETGEGAHLVMDHDGQVLALYERFGPDAVGVDYHARKREAPKTHLHCTAAGKAILACYSEERVRELVSQRGLPQVTPQTITDVSELLSEIEQIRERGFAVVDGEQMRRIRAIGAPIKDQSGVVVGSISLSAPASRLKGSTFRETMPEHVIHAANVAEINLQANDASR